MQGIICYDLLSKTQTVRLGVVETEGSSGQFYTDCSDVKIKGQTDLASPGIYSVM